MARKTHCKRGHLYTDSSVYVTKTGGRSCRPCRNVRYREKHPIAEVVVDPQQMTVYDRIESERAVEDQVAREMAKVMMDESDAEILRDLAELTSADDSWPPATVITTHQQRDLLVAAGCTADIEVPDDLHIEGVDAPLIIEEVDGEIVVMHDGKVHVC